MSVPRGAAASNQNRLATAELKISRASDSRDKAGFLQALDGERLRSSLNCAKKSLDMEGRELQLVENQLKAFKLARRAPPKVQSVKAPPVKTCAACRYRGRSFSLREQLRDAAWSSPCCWRCRRMALAPSSPSQRRCRPLSWGTLRSGSSWPASSPVRNANAGTRDRLPLTEPAAHVRDHAVDLPRPAAMAFSLSHVPSITTSPSFTWSRRSFTQNTTFTVLAGFRRPDCTSTSSS